MGTKYLWLVTINELQITVVPSDLLAVDAGKFSFFIDEPVWDDDGSNLRLNMYAEQPSEALQVAWEHWQADCVEGHTVEAIWERNGYAPDEVAR